MPYIYQGSPFYAPIRWMFAVSERDIWFGNGVHWDGQRFQNADIADAIFIGIGTTKMWASTNGKLYVVGNQGAIAYSSNNGTSWQRLESGTTTRINDAWGLVNPVTGKEEVYCPVSSFFTQGDKRILKITDRARVDSLRWDTGRNVFSVWTNKGFSIYTAGSGSYENSRGVWREASLPSIYTNAVRGTSPANIVVAGDFGLVAHFNGSNWQVFNEVYNAAYGSISMSRTAVAIVGERNSKGVVTIGRR